MLLMMQRKTCVKKPHALSCDVLINSCLRTVIEGSLMIYLYSHDDDDDFSLGMCAPDV